jgi:hypothetical protein
MRVEADAGGAESHVAAPAAAAEVVADNVPPPPSPPASVAGADSDTPATHPAAKKTAKGRGGSGGAANLKQPY